MNRIKSEWAALIGLVLVLLTTIKHNVAVYASLTGIQPGTWLYLYALLMVLAIDAAIIVFASNGNKRAAMGFSIAVAGLNLYYYHIEGVDILSWAALPAAIFSGITAYSIYWFTEIFLSRIQSTDELHLLKIEKADLLLKLSNMQTEISGMKQGVSGFQAQISKLKNDLSENESKLSKSTEDLSQANQEIGELRTELSRVQDAAMIIKNKLSTETGKLSVAENKLSGALEDLSTATEEIAQLKKLQSAFRESIISENEGLLPDSIKKKVSRIEERIRENHLTDAQKAYMNFQIEALTGMLKPVEA